MVYSALGSFYIPAVIMIFVYIRIFMVVYDRENLINKFHDSNQNNNNNINNNNNNNNISSQIPLKSNQNGLTSTKNLSDGLNDNQKNLINKQNKSSSCCCLCSRKKSKENPVVLTQQLSSSSTNTNINTHCSNVERKPNGYLIYRFTNPNNNNSTNSPPHTPPTSITKSIAATTFCRPCTLSTKKIINLSDEISNYRRNYLSHIGAEYQFRTGDSPCYELKTFENSLPPLIKCRSQSFEQQSSINSTRDFNTEFNQLNPTIKSNDKQQVRIICFILFCFMIFPRICHFLYRFYFI